MRMPLPLTHELVIEACGVREDNVTIGPVDVQDGAVPQHHVAGTGTRQVLQRRSARLSPQPPQSFQRTRHSLGLKRPPCCLSVPSPAIVLLQQLTLARSCVGPATPASHPSSIKPARYQDPHPTSLFSLSLSLPSRSPSSFAFLDAPKYGLLSERKPCWHMASLSHRAYLSELLFVAAHDGESGVVETLQDLDALAPPKVVEKACDEHCLARAASKVVERGAWHMPSTRIEVRIEVQHHLKRGAERNQPGQAHEVGQVQG